MKYTSQIEINSPIQRVVSLFDNPNNLKKWMKGLEKFEHLSGETGMPGAKSKLTFNMGRRKMEMTETIQVRNLPEEFTGTYEIQGTLNIVKNSFRKIDENKTLYSTENEFIFKGFMKVIAFIAPGMFKRQTMEYLKAFKEFAEAQ